MEKKAPRGKFRIIGKDNRDDPGWLRGDHSTLAKAKADVPDNGTVKFQIFNDRGVCVYKSPQNN